jgi:hypothetical protein
MQLQRQLTGKMFTLVLNFLLNFLHEDLHLTNFPRVQWHRPRGVQIILIIRN